MLELFLAGHKLSELPITELDENGEIALVYQNCGYKSPTDDDATPFQTYRLSEGIEEIKCWIKSHPNANYIRDNKLKKDHFFIQLKGDNLSMVPTEKVIPLLQ